MELGPGYDVMIACAIVCKIDTIRKGLYVLAVVNGKVLDMNEVEINGKLISFDEFTKLDKSTILTFDARGCESLVSLNLPASTYVDARDCPYLVSLDIPAATKVYARLCKSLVSLDLPAATYVDVSLCPSLVSLDLPAVTELDARGCTSLVSLNLPAATYVDARGCTSLVSLNLPAATLVSFDGCTSLSPDELSKVVQSMRDGEFKTACPAPVISATIESAP